MKSYQVLCKTCGGSGSILNPNLTGNTTSNPTTEICPVCHGSKTQWIYETDNIAELLNSGSITFTDAIRLMQ